MKAVMRSRKVKDKPGNLQKKQDKGASNDL